MSKVWLITGSSRGLGRAFVEAALDAGDSVVAGARNPAQLAEVEKKYGERVRAVALDVTREAQAKSAVDAALETFGGLDVLVNNAGYGNVAPVEDTTLEEFRAQIETNLFGVIIMTKAVIPYFRQRGAGHIVQVTSIAGRLGPVGRAPYAAAKFGVEGFSESTVERAWAARGEGDDCGTGWFSHGLRRVLYGSSRRAGGVRFDCGRYGAVSAELRREAAGRSGKGGYGSFAACVDGGASAAPVAWK